MAKYLEYSIRKICNYLHIDTEIIVSSTMHKDNGLKGQNKVIEIAHVLSADEYINAIGGQNLYSYQDFTNQGIKLMFLKTRTIEYKQYDNKFVPNLSILDVIMFNSVERIKTMLESFELLSEVN